MSPPPARWPVESRAFLTAAAGLLAIDLAAPAALPASVQLAVLVAAVAIAGIPHGALDPVLARRAGLGRRGWPFLRFNIVYIAIALLSAGAWLMAPVAALAVFLAISAWHFSGDWPRLPVWARALAGAGLIALPAFAHPGEVARIFAVLSGEQAGRLAELMHAAGPVLAGGLALAVLAALMRQPRGAAELAAIGALALALPPLVYFAAYFALLHSPRHLRGLFESMPARLRPRLARTSALYTGLTLAAAGLGWLAWPDGDVEARALRLVFIGLAALTVPHMALVAYAARKGVPTPRA